MKSWNAIVISCIISISLSVIEMWFMNERNVYHLIRKLLDYVYFIFEFTAIYLLLRDAINVPERQFLY